MTFADFGVIGRANVVTQMFAVGDIDQHPYATYLCDCYLIDHLTPWSLFDLVTLLDRASFGLPM